MHSAFHANHPRPRPRLDRLLGVVLALACPTNAPSQPLPNRIPALHAVTLAGQTVDLPADLSGKVGILVVGFSRESRAPAATWGKRLSADFDRSPNILYFELPVLEDVPRLLRGLVLRSIARELSSPAQAHFIPITTNQTQWKSVAHFADANSAYVLVVDSSGNIRWQTSGEPNDDRYAALRHAVSTALAHPAPAP